MNIRNERARGSAVRATCAVLIAAALATGCDVENPTAVTTETADPLHLTRGAMYYVEAQYSTIAAAVFLASDEGTTNSGFYASPDETGDASTYFFFDRAFTGFHQARELAAAAVDRALELGRTDVLPLTHNNYGWILTRLAELWGAQPFGDGVTHSRTEILELALDQFRAAVAAADPVTDSVIRLNALSGVARVHWQLGLDNGTDAAHLESAIVAAEAVLAEDPEFFYGPFIARSNYLSGFGGSYFPTEPFEAIPHPLPEDVEDPLVQFIDADELRLIIAESELLLGNLDAAKAAVKATALLPVNNVGLGRAPEDPPLTQAEVDALIDPLDAEGLQVVIDELQRENQFGLGRRSAGPNGSIFPIPLPPNA